MEVYSRISVVIGVRDSHCVRHGFFSGKAVIIVTQDYNGPCRLLAATNALALLGRVGLCGSGCDHLEVARLRSTIISYMFDGHPQVPLFVSPLSHGVGGKNVLNLTGPVQSQEQE
ncbi:hypothetical protein TRVL_06889 [Trypanosoma vivax]|nr:hypothetical protein TRVL_06889 [Trypanosoma vivax]